MRIGAIALTMALVIFCAGCPAKDAAVAVNRYAESLSHLQDAEIVAFNNGTIDGPTHGTILRAEKLASKAGRDLNSAIKIASAGGDVAQYTDAALKGYSDLVLALKPTNNQSLIVLGNAAGDLLKNAITMIEQLKAQAKPSPAKAALTLGGAYGA